MNSTLRMLALAVLLLAAGGRLSAAPSAGSAAAMAPGMPSRGGTVVVKVSDYDVARQHVLDAALAQGAELVDGRMQVNYQGKKHGWMRLRLEAERLPALLTAVQSTGKLYSQRLMSAEHRSEYEELERRIDHARSAACP
jgi:hypothetical protein